MKQYALVFKTKAVRVFIDEDGNPMWIGKEVCEVLGIRFYRNALARLDEDESCGVTVNTNRGPRTMAGVNEAGLYTLILQSTKPEAKAFRRWVTHEVLPAIRKYGKYEIEERNRELDQECNELVCQNENLQARVSELLPLAEAYENIAHAKQTVPLPVAVKAVSSQNGIGPHGIYRALRNSRILFKLYGIHVPYVQYHNRYFVVSSVAPYTRVRVPDGINLIYKCLGGQHG